MDHRDSFDRSPRGVARPGWFRHHPDVSTRTEQAPPSRAADRTPRCRGRLGRSISSAGVTTVADLHRCHGGAARSVIPPPPELPGLPLRHLLRGTPREHNSSGQQCQPSDHPNHHQVERRASAASGGSSGLSALLHPQAYVPRHGREARCVRPAGPGWPSTTCASSSSGCSASWMAPCLMTKQEGQLSDHLRRCRLVGRGVVLAISSVWFWSS